VPPLSIRPAEKTDLPVLVDLLADDELGSAREDASRPIRQEYVAAFDALERDSNQLLVVAECDARVVGCLQITFVPGLSRLGAWRGQLESVRIASDARGSGYGRSLFEWAIAECRRRGCSLVQLTSDKARKDALAFYRSLGFEASHEGLKLTL